MSSTSLTRADYCPNCGHTYIARFDQQRRVYRIGCPPERCDAVVEQITEQFIACVADPIREVYVERLLRLGVPPEQIAGDSGDGDEGREDVEYPTV